MEEREKETEKAEALRKGLRAGRKVTYALTYEKGGGRMEASRVTETSARRRLLTVPVPEDGCFTAVFPAGRDFVNLCYEEEDGCRLCVLPSGGGKERKETVVEKLLNAVFGEKLLAVSYAPSADLRSVGLMDGSWDRGGGAPAEIMRAERVPVPRSGLMRPRGECVIAAVPPDREMDVVLTEEEGGLAGITAVVRGKGTRTGRKAQAEVMRPGPAAGYVMMEWRDGTG